MNHYVIVIIVILLIISIIFLSDLIDRDDIITAKEDNVYLIDERIENITEITAQNGININAVSYETFGNYIVDKNTKFESLLTDDSIDFSTRKGFIVSGFDREPGILDGFVKKLNQCGEVVSVFFTENGDMVFIVDNIDTLKEFKDCIESS